ncbi:MAG: hypothetical protein ACK4IY_05615, partial [Chitinophagales bacterium]
WAWCQFFSVAAQTDTVFIYPVVRLDSVVIAESRSGFNVEEFIRFVEQDTTFYQAFRNLRTIAYTTLANVRMFNSKGVVEASLHSKSVQSVAGNCRWMEQNYQYATGSIFDKRGEMAYYTAKMFAYLFLYNDTLCSGVETAKKKSKSESQLEKRKEQLKTLVFNPGKPVEGIPFINSKLSIFDPAMMPYYDYTITSQRYNGTTECYVFTIAAKSGVKENEVVLKFMETWFNKADFSILARDYRLSTDNLLFDFDVTMQVKMTRIAQQMVPGAVVYNGTWNAPGKRRETGNVHIQISE